MTTITQLSYIVALDHHGSFKKAAKACFVTQPTLSMQIQKLEDQLGVIIFDRSKQPIQATIIGMKIIEQARTILRNVESIDDIISQEKDVIDGNVRLGIIPTLAPYLLPRFTKPFIQKYPNVLLTIEEMKTDDLISCLKTDRIDIALLVTPIQDSSLASYHLFDEPFYTYAHTNSDLCKFDILTNEHIQRNDLLLLTEGHCMRDQMVNLCKIREAQRLSGEKQLWFESGSIETLTLMVDQDLGFTIIPHLAKLQLRRNSPGRIIPFTDPTPTREVSLATHVSFAKSSLIKAISETLISSLPDELQQRSKNIKTIPIY